MKQEVLDKIICDSCRHCTDKELVKGHRRRGFCRHGNGWVPLGKIRQCLYYETKAAVPHRYDKVPNPLNNISKHLKRV